MNFATSEACRRCETPLSREAPLSPEPSSEDGLVPPKPRSGEGGLVPPKPHSGEGGRSLGRWLLWILGVSATILVTAFVSLLLTSEGLTARERQMVMNAVVVLEDAGFAKEARALRHVTSFRRTDNWWNRYVGHPTAYAATNFPFAVVTLYPAFFRFPIDDAERATILLHEAYHVFGNDETFALRRVWFVKARLGWTSLRYSQTRVWKNTREWTLGAVPSLFTCGDDGQSDCVE